MHKGIYVLVYKYHPTNIRINSVYFVLHFSNVQNCTNCIFAIERLIYTMGY
nr:MAG TPA: hypothetical protein [Caudoviricetes sp.]